MLWELVERRRRHRFVSLATDGMNLLFRRGGRCIGGCRSGCRGRVGGRSCCSAAIQDTDKAPSSKHKIRLRRLGVGSGEMSCGTNDEEGKGASGGCEGWSCHCCFFRLERNDEMLEMRSSDLES